MAARWSPTASSTLSRHAATGRSGASTRRRGWTLVNRGRFPRGEDGLASPICSHGNVYFTTTGGIYCLRDPQKTPGVGTVKPAAPEAPVTEDPQPAYVQVVPAEVLLQPGQSKTFRARLFNARGQLLQETRGGLLGQGPGLDQRPGTIPGHRGRGTSGSNRRSHGRWAARPGSRANRPATALDIHL